MSIERSIDLLDRRGNRVLLCILIRRRTARRARIDGAKEVGQTLHRVHAWILVGALGDLRHSAERNAARSGDLPLRYRLGAQVAHHEGVEVWEVAHEKNHIAIHGEMQ